MEYRLFIEIALHVIGGLGVFLFGMKNMSEGMQAVAGNRLRRMISAATDNRLLAVAMGTLVTCMIQSSSVTTVMVVGLVNSGFMTLMQAIGVIFGANIGTTVTGWLLTLKIGKYGLPILGIFALVYLFARRDRVRYTGMAIMGIGMVFFGLELMSDGFAPLRTHPMFRQWFVAFQATSYLGVLKCALVGCILTVIVQSSSATMGITMGLAQTGVIPFETAAALILGENIGTTITAYLASLGANTSARRAAYAHIFFNVLGVLWVTALFPYYIRLINFLLHDPGHVLVVDGENTFPGVLAGIALVHSGFNVTNTLIFLPLMGTLARFVTWLAPERAGKEPHRLSYLDVRMLDTPALGIEQSQKEVLFMGDSVLQMLDRLRETLAEPELNEERQRKIFHREEILDNVQREIAVFLGRMLSGNVAHDTTREGTRQLRIADEYESISDYVVNILKMYLKLRRNGEDLSEEGRTELLDLHDHVRRYAAGVHRAVRDETPGILSRAHTEGAAVTHLMKDYRRRHLERLAEEEVSPIKSLMFTDMLNAYRRIKDHMLNVAEALAGEK